MDLSKLCHALDFTYLRDRAMLPAVIVIVDWRTWSDKELSVVGLCCCCCCDAMTVIMMAAARSVPRTYRPTCIIGLKQILLVAPVKDISFSHLVPSAMLWVDAVHKHVGLCQVARLKKWKKNNNWNLMKKRNKIDRHGQSWHIPPQPALTGGLQKWQGCRSVGPYIGVKGPHRSERAPCR